MDFESFNRRPLSLKHILLTVVDLPQVEPFQSAIGWRHSRQALLVRWIDNDNNWGIGECSCRPDPYFSHEFLDGAVAVIREHIFPLLRGKTTYGEVTAILDRVRGWEFAKASVLEAIHDLWRRSGLPDPLDHQAGHLTKRIPVGISLGIFPTAAALIERIESAISAGYRRVKMKIKPGMAQNYLEQVRAAFPDFYLGCDANGSYGEEHLEELKRLEDLDLAMVEQPFAPDRLDLCARLKAEAPRLSICLDESVSALGHLACAHQMGALDELNIKPGRVGGIPKAMAMAEFCRQRNIPVWVGGMFETGIGRAANLRLAARFPQAKAHDLSPSLRYFKKDLVTTPLVMDPDGTILLPNQPVPLMDARIEEFKIKEIKCSIP